MKFPIDAVFLSRKGAVVFQTTLKPWHISRWVPAACGVLELPAGTLSRTGTQVGDLLSLEEGGG